MVREFGVVSSVLRQGAVAVFEHGTGILSATQSGEFLDYLSDLLM
jgi:hypothetical protein